jgi:Ras-related protein Rab-5C
MPESAPAGSKPSSSVKLVLLGEAAVGKVGYLRRNGGININMR